MATLIWIRTDNHPYVVPFERAMLRDDDLCLNGIRLIRPNAPRYLIAKGNIIEGIVARW